MSDLISKQAVLDHASQEANRDGGDFERWTIFAGKTNSGDFDNSEPSEVQRLREALQFYANPATYDIEHLNQHGYIIIDHDGGAIAREALSSHSEKEINAIRPDVATIREHGDKVQKMIDEIKSLEATHEANEYT